MGVARGIFSNEAGLGSAAMAHATATPGGAMDDLKEAGEDLKDAGEDMAEDIGDAARKVTDDVKNGVSRALK